jgi:hypothetical protein
MSDQWSGRSPSGPYGETGEALGFDLSRKATGWCDSVSASSAD